MNARIKYSPLITGKIKPVSSKSISNRALIIHALTGNACELKNLSESDDTNTLLTLLHKLDASSEEIIHLDAGPAGTVMRFLLVYGCLSRKKIHLTGDARMQERPMANLIEALRHMGANITCNNQEGFAPLLISPSKLRGGIISLDASVSSQFVSALLLCAPYFEKGIELLLTGKVVSSSYIMLTIEVMRHFGIHVEFKGDNLFVKPGNYSPAKFTVEGDWSSASYFYSLASFTPKSEIELEGMNLASAQGDKAIVAIGEKFGVSTTQTMSGILLKRLTDTVIADKFEYDFTLCPDIAQTVAVIACGNKVKDIHLTGLSTLTVKETDRIHAIATELKKFGVTILQMNREEMRMDASGFQLYKGLVTTYHDHRMAMSFAPLAQVTGELTIENEGSVKKSYVRYWDDIKSLGCIVENTDI